MVFLKKMKAKLEDFNGFLKENKKQNLRISSNWSKNGKHE